MTQENDKPTTDLLPDLLPEECPEAIYVNKFGAGSTWTDEESGEWKLKYVRADLCCAQQNEPDNEAKRAALEFILLDIEGHKRQLNGTALNEYPDATKKRLKVMCQDHIKLLETIRDVLMQPQPLAVLEGWKLVPIEPMDNQIMVCCTVKPLCKCDAGLRIETLKKYYKAMVEHAPPPETCSERGDE